MREANMSADSCQMVEQLVRPVVGHYRGVDWEASDEDN